MDVIRVLPAALTGFWLATTVAQPAAQPSAPPPRIWLTAPVLSAVKAKAAAGDRDWLAVKATADRLLTQRAPRFTVVAATNTDPVQFTIEEPIPWTGATPIFIGGGTGPWAAVNSSGGDRPNPAVATRTDPNRFTVPIDARSLGDFSGQHLRLFFSQGGFSGYGYQGSDWQSALETLGLAYQATGNAAYATKGIEWLDYIASLGVARMLAPEAIDSGFPSRSTIVGLGLAYDWFRDRLKPEQKTAAIQALNFWYDWFVRAGFQNDGPAYGNYFGGHILGFGIAGYATEFDNPRGKEIVADIRRRFEQHATPAFTTGAFAGGYPVEAFTYGANHFQRLLMYMLAIRTATGENLLDATGYARNMARSLLYNLKPNRWQVTDEGNYPGDYTGVLQLTFPIVLSHVLDGTREGGWMQFLYQHLASPPGGQVDDAFSRLLFYDARRAAIDYRATEPTWYHSPGDEHLYRRSTWRDDAVWTSFNGGSASWSPGHQMRASGHVSIQRGADYLLVNSGQWKGASGLTGSPAAFDVRSWRGNTLFVDDSGDYLFTGENYAGGQGFWGVNAVLGSEGSAEFAYMKTDLTTAYTVGDRAPFGNRSVRSFHRSFVSMGSGIVVLFDRVLLRKNTYKAKLFFHLNPAAGVPAIVDRTVTSRVGASVLFMKTLLPAAPALDAAPDPVNDGDKRPITYRVEVSDSTSAPAFNALTVFVAGPASAKAMPRMERLESRQGNVVGAIVDDGDVERAALFSTDGEAQSRVTYTATFPARPRGFFQVVADLVPGASYDVVLDGATLSRVTASTQGVASFQTASGGAFEIRRVVVPRPANPSAHPSRAQ